MLALGFTLFADGLWTTWAAVGAGTVVTSLVIGSAVIYERWRRRLKTASREEDLPWKDLLSQIEQRNSDRAKVGLPPEEPTQEMLDQFLANMLAMPNPTWELPEDREFLDLGNNDRRAGRRRWGNPTEVNLHSANWYFPLHGLVVNRSTGGLGIYADKEVPQGTLMEIRAVEAPANIPGIQVEVRHCRKVGKGFFIGCMFTEEIPWNVRVWFG
jgi:hypothetical protein